MITKNFALNITTCLSGHSFSFDELIIETRLLFETEGVPGFLKVLIALIDNMVVEDWKLRNDIGCCETAKLLRNGKKSKNIYTSLGPINFEWSRLKCKNCGKIHHPLKEFFGLAVKPNQMNLKRFAWKQ